MLCKVLDIKENKDGSADVTFEIDGEFKEAIKTHCNRKRFTQKLFSDFTKKALSEYVTLKYGNK